MKINRYVAIILFLSCFMIALANISFAEIIDKGEIRFKRGGSSGTYSDTVLSGDQDQYYLMAGASQWMEVKTISVEDNAVFQLSVYQHGTGKDISLKNASDGVDAKYWYGRLPNPGFSKNGKQNAVDIIVGGTRGNALYNMTVTIKNHD